MKPDECAIVTIASWLTENEGQFIQWMATQRWYGDKSRTVASVAHSILAELELDGASFSLQQVDVAYEDGGRSAYFVPLRSVSDGPPPDAFGDERFLKWLATGFAENRSLESASGDGATIRWSREGDDDRWASELPRVLTGEQSNTSVMFGSAAIAKVFRKVQPGINPDSEIVSFLTRQGEFHQVPTFLGAIRLEYPDGRESIELAAVQGFVANEGDCWRWLPGTLVSADEAGRDMILSDVELLGQRTGQLHVALADGMGEPAFQGDPYGSADCEELEDRIAREVRSTVSMLHRQGACSEGESEALTESLLADLSLADVFLGYFRTRVHGDYHLGQVLRSGNDFVIIDFEGEPSRTMSERREKHSPLKDVAGMLRSIDYAVASAGQAMGEDQRRGLRAWGRNAEKSFLAGYLSAVDKGPDNLLPRDPELFERALSVFVIEKALYEVRYELDNRPDWLEIPLGALKRIGLQDLGE